MNKPVDRCISVSPLVLCISAIRILSLVLTFVLGILCDREMAAGNIGAASRLGLAHGVSGMIFAGLVVYHVWTHRRWFADMLGEPGSWKQQAEHHVVPLYMALFVSVVVSGIVLACGSSASIAFHVGAGLMLCLVAMLHIVLHIGRKIKNS